MTDLAKTTERDEVLFAFHEAFERPTAADIIEWTKRYPQFADDIRAHAAIAWDWATSRTEAEQPIDEVTRTLLKAWSFGGVTPADAAMLEVVTDLFSAEDCTRGFLNRAEAIDRGVQAPEIIFNNR
jgi:hypothetical protein